MNWCCYSLLNDLQLFPVKARYPPEEEWNENWDEDDQDSFMKYREDLCDLGVRIIFFRFIIYRYSVT